MFTRRVATGLIASSVLLTRQAVAQPRVILRRSASTLDATAPEMRALAHAIPLMRQSGFWGRLVSVHANDWHQHHSWLFLPWHRAFLQTFERAVRELTYDDFRMPYLDWDADRIPEILFQPPFLHESRAHGPADSMRGFQSAQLSFRQGAPSGFDDFFGAPDYGGDDESFGHNLVHVFVGGDMGNISTAPRDPIFYFHHANVDRLWWYWAQNYGCSQSDCYPPDWLDQSLNGIVDTDGHPMPPISVRSLLSTAALGYDYPPLPMVAMAAPPMQNMAPRREIARPPYTSNLHLAGPSQAFDISLPHALALALLTASRADVTARLFVRSQASAPHEIRISLADGSASEPERIFAMPMGEMGASYVKNVGTLLASLAKGLSADQARAYLSRAPAALRVEAIAFAGGRPVLVECALKITAVTWG